MKNIYSISTFLILTILLGTACSNKMYQVMDVKSSDLKSDSSILFYESPEIKLEYYFWDKNGSILFSLKNKTNKPIYVDWFKCHVVYDGISYEYWNDSEQTDVFYTSSGAYSKYSSTTTSKTVVTSTIKPNRKIQIPANSAIYVNKFYVNANFYYTCDYHIKPRNTRNPVSINFGEDKSPYKFRNIITYSTTESFDSETIIDNAFYIGGIHVMNEKLFNGKKKIIERCNSWGEVVKTPEFPYPFRNQSSFYLQ